MFNLNPSVEYINMTTLTTSVVLFSSFFLLVSHHVTLVNSTPPLSSLFKLCRKSDPSLGQCIADAINKGLKVFKNGSREFSVTTIDPLHVDLMDLGETTGAVSLKQTYKNVDFYGISDMWHNDTRASMEDDNCFVDYKAYGKELRMEADYEIKGSVLVFPINGHGKCVNILYGQVSHAKLTCEKYMKKGKKYIRMTSYSLELQLDSMHFGFENVIDANKQMNDEVLKTINENSKAVFADVKAGFESALSQIFLQHFNGFFAKHPESELFLP